VDVIFISSDKAVEPISLYGMTKAIGEYLTRESGGYIARCGNFLGSSGSVIPVWEKAIRESKPVKITDRRMKRFVIDPSDAAKQIWDGYLRGERLIIPKCKEVSIIKLLDTISDNGYSHGNIKIKTIGIRPGEKLREKLRWDWEE
jgi:FlaA1/EpsC-like NDP-sugar epimerase